MDGSDKRVYIGAKDKGYKDGLQLPVHIGPNKAISPFGIKNNSALSRKNSTHLL